MLNLLSIDITTEACRWISLNPSYVLWPGLLGLIILIVALYYLFKIKSSKAKTFAELTNQKKKVNEEKERAAEISSLLESTNNELNNNKEQINQSEQEKRSLRARVASLSGHKQRLEQLKSSAEEKVRQLTESTNNLNQIIEQRDNKIEELEGRVTSLTTSLSDKEGTIRQRDNKIEELEGRLTTLITSLSDKEGTIRQRDSKIEELEGRVTTLTTSLSDKEGTIRQRDSKIEELEGRVTSLTTSLSDKEGTISQRDSKIEELEGRVTSLTTSLSDKEGTISQRDGRIEELQEQLRNIPDVSRLKEENELYIRRLQEITAKLDEKEKALEEADLLANSRGEKIGNLQEDLRKSNGKIEELNTKILALTNELAQLKQQIEETPKPSENPEPPVEPEGGGDGPEEPIENPEPPVEPEGDGDGPEEPIENPEPPVEPEGDGDGPEEPIEKPEPPVEPEGDGDGPEEPIEKPEPPVEPEGDGDGPEEPTEKQEQPVEPEGDGDGPEEPTEKQEQPVEPEGDGDGPKEPTEKQEQPVEPEGDDEEYVDLPTIDKKTGKVKRSILRVVDIEQEPPLTIDSDEFFSKEPEYIERVARVLAEASATGRKAYVCECCKEPVKIAKRDFGSHEVLFFSHCHRDIKCEWKQEQSITKTPKSTGVDVGGEPLFDGNIKKHIVKDLISRSLQTDVSKSKGVKDVEESKILKSKYKFIRYRRAGIFARYKERNLVFELLTRDVLMNRVVDKDLFCRLHDHHVIWIFGADGGKSYDYIKRHVNMNTMYANRRNVFIIDKEAMDACEERNELVLKCNYLDPDNKWHYRSETTGNNGILITLEDLQFDDEMCKPYFFDANIEYFKINPKAEEEYKDSIIDREKLLKDLQDTYEGRLAEIRKKNNKKNTQPEYISETDPETDPESDSDSDIVVTCTEFAGRYLYFHNDKYGIVDENDNFIIPCEYDDIECWASGKYIVKVIDQWGVIDESQNIIASIKFQSIGELNKGKAQVKTSIESYYIDENGNRLPDETIKMHNGWTKFRFGKKWGIWDEEKIVIVEPVYDEIGSFRCRLIGIRNGSFQKLVPRYEYRLKMHCTCSDNVDQRAVYNVNGLLLKETSLQEKEIGKVYKSKIISNISFKTGTIYVNDVSPRKENEEFPHVDNDYDFKMGEILTGIILKKVMKKIYIQFNDGRLSYFNKTLLERTGKQLSDYGKGKEITLQKIGYDSDYERTEWKLVEQSQ